MRQTVNCIDLSDLDDSDAPVIACAIWAEKVIRFKDYEILDDGKFRLRGQDGREHFFEQIILVKNSMDDQDIIDFYELSQR